jgi:threonine synthase
MGPRSNAAEAAQKAVLAAVSSTTAYASHAYLPHNLAGYATLAFELVEQLGRAPGTLIAPVGQGGLLLGAARGFESLLRAGLITALPTLVGVQARACAPLWAVYQFGAPGMSWMTEGQTLAEGVRVMRPVRGDALLTWLRANGGMVVAVEEEQILPGVQELAAQGLYVEPTSALVWNALAQVIDAAPEPIVAVLTGSGLKV